jgi:hypothetical protein
LYLPNLELTVREIKPSLLFTFPQLVVLATLRTFRAWRPSLFFSSLFFSSLFFSSLFFSSLFFFLSSFFSLLAPLSPLPVFYREKERGPANPYGFGAPGELRGLAFDPPGATESKMLRIAGGVG